MTWQAWATVGVISSTIALLTFTRAAADLTMIGAVAVLLTFGILNENDALLGFANEGTITVGVLFIVAAGVRETGAMMWLGQRVLGRPRSVPAAQLRMVLPTAAMSAFLNNTPLVAVMLPVVSDWAKKHRIALSKVMMPLSYAAILGGLCTLIGTSANLVVAGLWAKATQQSLRLFDPAWVGVPCAIAGVIYILAFSRWLLPDRKPAISDQDDPRQYTVEMVVDEKGPLVGLTIEQAGLRHLPGLYLAEIVRQNELLPAVSPRERLSGNDRLLFVGIVESVVDLQKIRGLKPATDQVFKLGGAREQRCLIEAVVSNTCPLVGQSIREGQFRTVYDAAVIALARNGQRVNKKLGDVVLQPGDTLLLEAHPEFAARHRNSRDFFLVNKIDDSAPPRHNRMWVAMAILAGLIVAAGFEWLSMLNASMLAAGLMVLTGCCSIDAARRGIDWQVLIVIGASFALGRALEVTGAAKTIAETLIQPVHGQPWVALAIVYGLTMLFTEVTSNTAAAVLVFPIALATANSMGVNALPFVMAIMIAASCGFAVPFGYATHLMVYGPGSYRFLDFVRFGGLLNLVIWAVTVAIVPLVWPF
jgi:di/tricarboxylate transporter